MKEGLEYLLLVVATSARIPVGAATRILMCFGLDRSGIGGSFLRSDAQRGRFRAGYPGRLGVT